MVKTFQDFKQDYEISIISEKQLSAKGKRVRGRFFFKPKELDHVLDTYDVFASIRAQCASLSPGVINFKMSQLVFQKTLDLLTDELRDKLVEKSEESLNFGDSQDFVFYGIPVLNSYYYLPILRSGSIYVLDNSRTKVVAKFNNSQIMRDIFDAVSFKFKSKGLAAFKENRVTKYKGEFDPTQPIVFERKDRHYINTYKRPKYLTSAKPREDLELYHKFMKTVFPTVRSRKCVEAWAAETLRGKALTHLLLVGAKGAGKSFFASSILGPLHGFENYYVKSGTAKRSAFDFPESEKTLCFSDECSFTDEEAKSKIKLCLNPQGSYNQKFKVNDSLERSFSSFIFACNYASSIRLELDDRYFSVPDIVDRNIADIPGFIDSVIVPLAKALKRPEYLKSVHDYLLEDNLPRNKPIIIRSQNEKRLVFQTDIEPRGSLLRLCQSQQRFSLHDIEESARRSKEYRDTAVRPVSVEDVVSWAEKYESVFSQKLLSVREDGSFDSEIYRYKGA